MIKRKTNIVVIFLVVIGIFFGCVNINESRTLKFYLQNSLKTLYGISGEAFTSFADKNYLYIAYGEGGLKIIDITDPKEFEFLSSFDSQVQNVIDVIVKDNTAYVADMYKGIFILDVLNPQNPILLSNLTIDGRIHSIFLWNNFLIINSREMGIRIVDISNPNAPSLVRSYKTPEISLSCAVYKNYLYIADSKSLEILQISNDGELKFVGRILSEFDIEDLFIEQDRLYVVDTEGANIFVGSPNRDDNVKTILKIFSLTNASSPTLLGKYETEKVTTEKSRRLFVKDNIAYLSVGFDGIEIIDVSNPSAPTIYSKIEPPENSLKYHGIFIKDNLAFVGIDWGGIEVIDISQTSSPTRISRYQLSERAQGLFLKDNKAYITMGRDALLTVDLNLKRISKLKIEGNLDKIIVKDEYAYVLDMIKGLRVFDISSSENPTSVSLFKKVGNNNPVDFEVLQNFAYILDGEEGVVVADISNPIDPIFLSQYTPQEKATVLEISGNYLFLGNAGVEIVSIGEHLNFKSRYESNYPVSDIAIKGNYLYLVHFDPTIGIIVLDISNLNSPKKVGEFKEVKPGKKRALIDGNYLFLVQQDSLSAIDISDPKKLKSVGKYDIRNPKDIFVKDGLIYLTSQDKDLLKILKTE